MSAIPRKVKLGVLLDDETVQRLNNVKAIRTQVARTQIVHDAVAFYETALRGTLTGLEAILVGTLADGRLVTVLLQGLLPPSKGTADGEVSGLIPISVPQVVKKGSGE